nr:MAG TPA: hypothetical protein [Caudoviricetes sp.]DAT92758.1 MAG TPA: hypothetical protein [Caudoviricetes sp.]DAX37377.1 MAG TPA: hypothetical protein [Caudoviricetes sp.]
MAKPFRHKKTAFLGGRNNMKKQKKPCFHKAFL